jgi:hypothetical protein
MMPGHGTKLRFAAQLWLIATMLTPANLSADDGDDIKASQTKLNPIAQFARCYGTITRKRLPRDHRLYEAVKSGSKSPADACMEVLHGATLRTNANPPRGQMVTINDETKAVIATFQDFHRSWFPSDNFVTSVPIGELYPFLRTLYDPTAPAMYVTRALFHPDLPFSSIVTERSGIFAYRDPYVVEVGFSPTPAPGQIQPFGYLNSRNERVTITPPFLIGRGEMVGIDLFQEFPNINGYALGDGAGWPVPSFPVYGHFGGGLLGNQSYLMLNFGRGE